MVARGLVHAAAALIAFCAMALPAAAQTTGTIVGTVKDAQGGVVPGASVVHHGLRRQNVFPTPVVDRSKIALRRIAPGEERHVRRPGQRRMDRGLTRPCSLACQTIDGRRRDVARPVDTESIGAKGIDRDDEDADGTRGRRRRCGPAAGDQRQRDNRRKGTNQRPPIIATGSPLVTGGVPTT